MKGIIKRVIFLLMLVFMLSILSTCYKNSPNSNKNNKIEVKNNNGFAKAPVLIAEKVWLINDNGADNIFLVVGEKQAMLIDTGTGNSDLAALVKTLTKLPVIVFNTHGHPDHSGGNYSFDKVYAHPADFDAIRRYGSRGNGVKLIAVKNGDCIDLGNRVIEVIEAQGHTQDSICLIDKKYKLLFTGDTCNTVSWLFLGNSTPLEVYLNSLQKLYSRNKEFMTIIPGHGVPIDSSFLGEIIECTKKILGGKYMYTISHLRRGR